MSVTKFLIAEIILLIQMLLAVEGVFDPHAASEHHTGGVLRQRMEVGGIGLLFSSYHLLLVVVDINALLRSLPFRRTPPWLLRPNLYDSARRCPTS